MTDWYEEAVKRGRNQRLQKGIGDEPIVIDTVRRAIRLIELNDGVSYKGRGFDMWTYVGEWRLLLTIYPPADPSPNDLMPEDLELTPVGYLMKTVNAEKLQIKRGNQMDLVDRDLILRINMFSTFQICSLEFDEAALNDLNQALQGELVLDDLSHI